MIYNATQVIAQYLESRGIKYKVEETEKNSFVFVGYNGEVAKGIKFRFFSSDNDNDVSVRVFNFIDFDASHTTAMMEACNQLNRDFRFAKFYVDTSDSSISVEYDMPLDAQTSSVGPEAYEICQRFVNILDKAYPIFMKVMWG